MSAGEIVQARFERITSLVDFLRSIDDWIVPTALPAFITSVQRARDVCGTADYGDPTQLREAIDAVLIVAQAGANCTVTDRDDTAVETIRSLRTSIDFLIPIIASWLKGERTFGATEQDAAIAGIDPTTIMLIVQIAVKLLEMWQRRK